MDYGVEELPGRRRTDVDRRAFDVWSIRLLARLLVIRVLALERDAVCVRVDAVAVRHVRVGRFRVNVEGEWL